MENRTKSVPYNNDAEMYVLGSILLENNIMNQVSGKLEADYFYNQQNSIIFKTMKKLFDNDQKIETVSVLEQLARDNISNLEDYKKYLIELLDMIPSTASVDLYVEVVEEKAIERILLTDLQELSNDILFSKYDFNKLLDNAEDIITEVIKKRRASKFVSIKQAAEEVYEQIEKFVDNKSDVTGLDTGYANLNKLTLGFQKGELIILAARPAVGKSAFAINLGLNVAEAMNRSKHVALFSLEMSIEQLMMRIFSYKTNIPLGNIKSGNLGNEDLILLQVAKQELGKYHLHFDENSSTNIADIRTKCRQLKQSDQLDFVIIDYLQLITSGDTRGNRQEEVSKISRQLKTLARELGIPVLALSQLSRGIETREDKRPVLADLRESGSIEQDADLVMFLYRRDDVEDRSDEDGTVVTNPKDKKPYLEVVLDIQKNRQGKTDYVDYHFYGDYSRFSEQKEKKPIITKKRRRARTKQLND